VCDIWWQGGEGGQKCHILWWRNLWTAPYEQFKEVIIKQPLNCEQPNGRCTEISWFWGCGERCRCWSRFRHGQLTVVVNVTVLVFQQTALQPVRHLPSEVQRRGQAGQMRSGHGVGATARVASPPQVEAATEQVTRYAALVALVPALLLPRPPVKPATQLAEGRAESSSVLKLMISLVRKRRLIELRSRPRCPDQRLLEPLTYSSKALSSSCFPRRFYFSTEREENGWHC